MWHLLILLGMLLTGCVLSACSGVPDENVLEQRLSATITLGWGWIHAENVELIKSQKTDKGLMGTFAYSLVIQKDAHHLPQTAIDTFRKYLPQCNSVPIQKGKRCTVEETLLFVESNTYGWVPEIIARLRPELLGPISSWETSETD